MNLQIEYIRYRRPFSKPLKTRYGTWRFREGVLVRLGDGLGRWGLGEIAPLEGFGSETLEQAETFCREIGGGISPEGVDGIPETLPCCRFAFESALQDLRRQPAGLPVAGPAVLPVAGLISGGTDAVSEAKRLSAQGFRTLKWKVGVRSFARERESFLRLVEAVPPGIRWRLDANGALDFRAAEKWGSFLDGSSVEFFEQPLPPSRTEELLRLAHSFPVPLGLDESVGTLRSLWQWNERGWPGIFVVKPALAGSPRALLSLVQQGGMRVVFSSALETAVGMKHALSVAAAANTGNRAVGWGTSAFFGRDGLSPDWGSIIHGQQIDGLATEPVWAWVTK